MKEFVDKLISRLEEVYDKWCAVYNISENDFYADGRSDGIQETIEIVKELAEEHKDKVMIDGQYCWQTCGATEHCKECNRLGNGYTDYYENYDFMVEPAPYQKEGDK